MTAAAAGVTEVAALPTEAGSYRLTADVTIDSTWIVTVADYASAAMHWAISADIIRGYEDNTLRPTATATRAEVAVIISRFCQSIA